MLDQFGSMSEQALPAGTCVLVSQAPHPDSTPGTQAPQNTPGVLTQIHPAATPFIGLISAEVSGIEYLTYLCEDGF